MSKVILNCAGLLLIFTMTGCRSFHGHHVNREFMRKDVKNRVVPNSTKEIFSCYQQDSNLVIEGIRVSRVAHIETSHYKEDVIKKYGLRKTLALSGSHENQFVETLNDYIMTVITTTVTPLSKDWNLDEEGLPWYWYLLYTPPISGITSLFAQHPVNAERFVYEYAGSRYVKEEVSHNVVRCSRFAPEGKIFDEQNRPLGKTESLSGEASIIELKSLFPRVKPCGKVGLVVSIGGQDIPYNVDTTLICGAETMSDLELVSDWQFPYRDRLRAAQRLFCNGRLTKDEKKTRQRMIVSEKRNYDAAIVDDGLRDTHDSRRAAIMSVKRKNMESIVDARLLLASKLREYSVEEALEVLTETESKLANEYSETDIEQGKLMLKITESRRSCEKEQRLNK